MHAETRTEQEETVEGVRRFTAAKGRAVLALRATTEPQIMGTVEPFSSSAVAPALRKLRHLLQRDAVDEQEVLAIFRGADRQDGRYFSM